jgi:hypothetical protein
MRVKHLLGIALAIACGPKDGALPATKAPATKTPAATVSEAPAQQRLWLELRAQAEVNQQRSALRQGDWLRSKDAVEFFVTVSRNAYVRLYQVSATGEVEFLYPGSRRGDLLVPAGVRTRVPERGWFHLDNVLGEETVIVVASLKPLAGADAATNIALHRAQTNERAPGNSSSASRCNVASLSVADGEAPVMGTETSDARASHGVVGETVHRVPVSAGVTDPAALPPAATKSRPGARRQEIDEFASLGRTRGLEHLRARGLVHHVEEDADSAVLFGADADNVVLNTFWFCHAPPLTE